jgi:D-serine dehydratase
MNLATDPKSDAFDALAAHTLTAATKGIPPQAGKIELGAVGRQGWNLLRGDLPFPLAVLSRSALEHNSRWMRAFIETNKLSIAPHGKTTMAPQLFRRQIEDGAWAITVATLQQLMVCRRFGFDRLLIANELIGAGELDVIFGELAGRPQLEIYCLVDSLAGIERIAAAGRRNGHPARLRLLLEMGIAGARTGCRSLDQALEIARAARREGLTLAGVEGFEGVLKETAAVDAFLDTICAAAEAIGHEGLFAAQGPVILSAGGSAFYDRVAARFAGCKLGGEVRIVTRSGCYLTHDSVTYEQSYRAMRAREDRHPGHHHGGLPTGDLLPALVVWTQLQSRPEPGRAILTMGRRDVSHDAGLPVPLLWYRRGLHEAPVAIGAGHAVAGLYDQHCCLDCPVESELAVGDLVAFGISHPCTTFDKWQVLYVADDRYDIVDAVKTFF